MERNIVLASPWGLLSRKLIHKIERPQFVGKFSEDKEAGRQIRVFHAAATSREGWIATLYWLVDEWDGVIVDVRYQAFGPAALLGALEGAAEWLMRKNYDQASKVKEKDIGACLEDKKDKEALPVQYRSVLEIIVKTIQECASQCLGIPLSEKYVPTPIQVPVSGTPYPGWEGLSTAEQIAVVESVIAEDIRPYIEMDAGGIEIVSLTEGKNLVIAYKGACTTCYSSVGSTLQAIQQILMDKVHPDIRVIPDSSFLNLS